MTIKIAYVCEGAPNAVNSIEFSFDERKSFDVDAELVLAKKIGDSDAAIVKPHICNYEVTFVPSSRRPKE